MRNRIFFIAEIVLIGISLCSIYSNAVIYESQNKFEKIKQQVYIRENRVTVNLKFPKDSYLLQVKHKIGQNQYRNISFNGFKLTENTWPYKRRNEDVETSYIHLPKEIVREGQNTINIAFSENPPLDGQIKLTNYRKQITNDAYILFSDSVHLLAFGKRFFRFHPFYNILLLSLVIITYSWGRNTFTHKDRFPVYYQRYLLSLLSVLQLLFLAGWACSNLSYRLVVTPFFFFELTFIILASVFVIEAYSSKSLQAFFSKTTGFLFTEQNFRIRTGIVFSFLIIVANLWVYWPSFFHLFRHDEWFLFFSSKDQMPNLQFIIEHIDWQLRLPYDRLVFRPIHHTMLAINRVIFDANYLGPHLITFIKHIFATFCLWQLMWQYSPRWISGFFVLLFSVLVVSADPAMLPHFDAYIITTILTILAAITFRKTVYDEVPASKGFALTSLLLFLNMLTTEVAFLMPFVFFCAYWAIFRSRVETVNKQKDKSSFIMLLPPMLLWLLLFSIHLYFAYPDFKMTSQSDMIVLWMPFFNVVRFILVLLSGIFLPMRTQPHYVDKIYFKVFSVDFVLLIVGTLICIRIGRKMFRTITKEIVFLVMLIFSIVVIVCFGRAWYVNACLNSFSLPSHYVYCVSALIICVIYVLLDFDKIRQSKKKVLSLLLILCFLTVDHAVRTRHSAIDIERRTAPLKKYFDSVRNFVNDHKKETDFSFKTIDRPPKIGVFNWYHETCIDGLFNRYINNESPKYLLEYDCVPENLRYSLYNEDREQIISSTVPQNITKDADYINSIGVCFKNISGQEGNFLIGMCEVTQKQWKQIMGFNPSRFKDDNHPVENVSYYEVVEFIERLNKMEAVNAYRLPTEQEYTYLANSHIINIAEVEQQDNIDRYAWLKNNAKGMTHPVGELHPIATGLYDLIGNVWEWTCDPINYNSVVEPLKYNPHICFGGSWREDVRNPDDLKTNYPLDFRHEHLGFRLVREIEEN